MSYEIMSKYKYSSNIGIDKIAYLRTLELEIIIFDYNSINNCDKRNN